MFAGPILQSPYNTVCFTVLWSFDIVQPASNIFPDTTTALNTVFYYRNDKKITHGLFTVRNEMRNETV